ncbi:MAG: hemolysin III family protein [Candidatus Pedobacter colombiensis]|uniref:Hemolysin III family protein n=1 Tax=Candidatus Pedobacter colombiensis TaxID=3121371 RepID=A0AAJ5W610_9SPHI|nr:hemolysin III family protein [Pedobacter sp.]WEK17758.1 MAG: hemolysin III family protein [Pedobacter sp.]
MKEIKAKFTRKQELINGLIHGIGVLFGISGLPVLVGIATAHNNVPAIVGAGIYGFCFLMLFTCSTVYHLAIELRVKRLFEILDHISIYFLIAGTYTPFLLIYMDNTFGITLLSVLWGLTLLGAFFKIWYTGKFNIISTVIYLLMGWMMLIGGKKFFAVLPASVVIMLFIGAGLYSAGTVFYTFGKRTYSHAIWHSLSLAAAICHYVAVLLSM